MGQGPTSWVPILLEGVHTNLTTGLSNVGVEYFSEEVAYMREIKLLSVPLGGF